MKSEPEKEKEPETFEIVHESISGENRQVLRVRVPDRRPRRDDEETRKEPVEHSEA